MRARRALRTRSHRKAFSMAAARWSQPLPFMPVLLLLSRQMGLDKSLMMHFDVPLQS